MARTKGFIVLERALGLSVRAAIGERRGVIQRTTLFCCYKSATHTHCAWHISCPGWTCVCRRAGLMDAQL